MRWIAIISLLCFVLLNSMQAQDEEGGIKITLNSSEDDPLSIRHSLGGGITYLNLSSLNSKLFSGSGFRQLYAIGYTLNFSNEPYTDPISGKMPGLDFSVAVNWFLPIEQQSSFPDNELTTYRLKGWELMTNFIGLNFLRSDRLDIVAGLGWYWGNLKLRATNLIGHTQIKTYSNPFVAPMIRTEIRCNFPLLSIGARASYRYDISRNEWRRKSDEMEPLPGYRFREFQILLYLGLRFVKE